MPLFETNIWIVHREAGPRSALARMAGGVRGRHELLLGTPSDLIFDSAAAPHVVVLDVSSAALDPEPELDFAQRISQRHPGCEWILVAEPVSLEAAELLFDALAARTIVYPPDSRTLQAAVSRALEGIQPLPLSRRIGRDRLSQRFGRWFGDGEAPDLGRILDARLAAEPVLARGEPGSGRGLLLRYAHDVSTLGSGAFVRLSCSETTRSDQLLTQIADGVRAAAGHGRRAGGRVGIWLEDVDQLGENLQTQIVDWIDFGLPPVLPASARTSVRWLASAGIDPNALDPRLALAFGELTIRTVPLRERPHFIEAFVADTARAWAAARREAAQAFDAPALELLRGEPWPGNLAELEALVIRSLAHASPEAETIRVLNLRFEPESSLDPSPAAAPGPPDPQPPPSDDRVARLAAAVAHEVRNPLVSIRTFTELLDDNYTDEEFRTRFGQLVSEDVRRIEDVVDRLEQMGEPSARTPSTSADTIDMTALLEGLLDEQRDSIQAKRLLVLKELDRAHPHSRGNAEVLRPALAGLLSHAVDEIPERGDLYLASRHHTATEGRASMRILIRYRVDAGSEPGRSDPARPSLRETVLDHVRGESAIQSQGGTLTIDTTQASETLIVIDLPAPPPT
ncbi:MAG: histidine kinase dimerization/phospho-acceptor domain-containing protein [Myxococcota bacterium]|nr:histidine kinase dimerization/phospho-acceptor domain-containing protein [Myxococcota bacterium]